MKLYEDIVMDKAFLGILGGGNKTNNDERRSHYSDRRDEPSFINPANTNHHNQN